MGVDVSFHGEIYSPALRIHAQIEGDFLCYRIARHFYVRTPRPTPPKDPAISAERRPITVMFYDLVGSTSMAAKLNAEDCRTLVNTYLDEAWRMAPR